MFLQLDTQWRVGINGATGLDYVAAKLIMDIEGVTDYPLFFDDVRIMEAAALREMNKEQPKADTVAP